MTESIYERINKVLTWKRIVAFNFVLVLVLIVPLSVKLSQQDTENRSNAAGEEVLIPSPIPVANYPKSLPTISRVSTFYGKPGDGLVILGSNFGDYQWESKLYVGSVEVGKNDITSWKNGVIEVNIPEAARTGEVRIAVNGQQVNWDGTLLLYDNLKSIKVGISKETDSIAKLWIEKGDSLSSGVVEISYIAEPINISSPNGVTVTPRAPQVDVLGKTIKLDIIVNQQLLRGQTPIAYIEHPQVGAIEITKVELYNNAGRLLEAYSDPLSLKLIP